MELKGRSFSLRGDSGVIRVVSDSPFTPDLPGSYTEEAECDISLESDGFRVSKAIVLKMEALSDFIKDVIAVSKAKSGTASFMGAQGEIALRFIVNGAEYKVECEMNDRNEGKDNCIQVRYPIEPSYVQELEQAIDAFIESSSKVQA
jgi:hypothetical protein